MANFKKPIKKTAIITVAILFVVAITSAVVLLKDRCFTKNVNLGTETEQVDRIENAKTTTVDTRTITGKITRAAMATTTTTDNIQESTITRNETVIIERPWETKYITWSPIKIKAKLALEDIITEKDEIIKFKTAKTAKVNGVEGATARVGDIIKYTISVENLCKYTTGKAFIQDLELKKLTSGEKPILELTDKDGNPLEGKEIAEKLMEGTTVDVEPGKTTEFTFNTRVLRVDGAIKNTVIIRTPDYPIDPSNPEEPSVKVETADLTVLKEVENKQEEYKLGDTVTYKVTVTNNGSTTLTNIKVTDQLQGVELISNSDVIEKLETHESATVEYRYTIQEKDLGTDSKQGTVNNVAIAKASDGTTNSGSETIVTEEKNADFEIRKFSYRVEYYYDNSKEPGVVINDIPEVDFGTKVTSVDTSTYKKDGYKLDVTKGNGGIVGTPLTITSDVESNVIKVYYVREEYPYTVTYYSGSTQLDKDTDIVGESSYTIKDFMGTVPTDYVFAGIWKDSSENVYAVGDTVKITANLNLYAQFETVEQAESAGKSFWQNKVTSWEVMKSQVTPVIVNGENTNQIFYCKSGITTVKIQSNGGIVSLNGKEVAKRDEVTLEKGKTYEIGVEKGGTSLLITVVVK